MKFTAALIASLFVTSALAEDAPKPWANESEMGVIVSKGNTDIQTYSLKSLTTYKWAKNTLAITGGYLNSFSNGAEQAKAWNLGLRYEYALTDRTSGFIGQSIDGDKFQSIRQRYNTDIGLKHYLVKEEAFYWFSEGGYRFTKENRSTQSLNFHKFRAYTEAEKKFGTGTSAKAGVEYLPNITQGKDWQINGHASVSAVMNSVFSLKTAYTIRYDNEPAPGVVKKTDHTVTSAIVAKF